MSLNYTESQTERIAQIFKYLFRDSWQSGAVERFIIFFCLFLFFFLSLCNLEFQVFKMKFVSYREKKKSLFKKPFILNLGCRQQSPLNQLSILENICVYPTSFTFELHSQRGGCAPFLCSILKNGFVFGAHMIYC